MQFLVAVISYRMLLPLTRDFFAIVKFLDIFHKVRVSKRLHYFFT